LNSPLSAFAVVSGIYKYPGQFYSILQQCQLALGLYILSIFLIYLFIIILSLGPSSTAQICNVRLKFKIYKKIYK
jgi:hypothetical protein